MKQDSRLSGALHALLHMAEQPGPMTSEELAACMHTNPVVVRRVMAGLRRAGFVRSEKGHGGGWSIARDLETLTLGDIHAALGSRTIFAIGNRSKNPQCLVEQAVNEALDGAFAEAEALLIARLDAVTLADLSAGFHRRMQAMKRKRRGHDHAV